MKNLTKKIITNLLVVAFFAIAMGHFEGTVSYYLRIFPFCNIDLNEAPLRTIGVVEYLNILPPYVYWIEITKEAATIVMLVSFAILIGKSKIEKGLIFLYTFAIWDLFFYISLYSIFGWPTSLSTIDVLFLIPAPWIAPVYVPIFISSATVVITTILLIKRPKKLFKLFS